MGVKLAVGDLVLYGAHGIGRVAARKEQVVLGLKQDVVVVELEDGLTVTLPLERAQSQLRSAASEADMARVRDTLRGDRELSVDNWLSRRNETLGKLTAGDPVQLAEIVSDGAQRQRLKRAAGSGGQLSSGERDIFLKARKLLSGEVALALGIQPDAAEGWIEEQLERPA
jgi:CarD family transcriptional regulator